MAYIVFISHSVEDVTIVNQVSESLKQIGVEAYIAEHELQPGFRLSQKIKDAIMKSDVVLAILTRKGTKSVWVNQELAYAEDKKPIIPLVEKVVVVKGFLEGKKYIAFDKSNLSGAINKATAFIQKLKASKEFLQIITCVTMLVLGTIILAMLVKK